MLNTYYFSYCQKDSRLVDVVKRILPYKKLFTENNSAQEKIQTEWAQEFIKSQHVLNFNISITGEPGVMLPWQVANLDIFN